MELTPKLQRVIGGLCGATMLVGAVAAATHDDAEDDPGVEAVGSASSTTAAPTVPGDPSATVVTVPGDPGVGTTAAPAGDPTAPPADGDAPPATGAGTGATPVPPATGEYRYEVTVGDVVTTSVLHIDADAAAPADRLVAYEGASLGLVERYRWGADGVYVIGGSFTALGDAGCEWQPPVLQVQAPVVAGATWEGASDCVASTQVGDIAVHASTRTTIVELIDVEVVGRTRRAARLSRDEDQVVTLSSSTVTSTSHYDDVIDVATGMVISSSASATTDGQPDGTSERRLTVAPADW